MMTVRKAPMRHGANMERNMKRLRARSTPRSAIVGAIVLLSSMGAAQAANDYPTATLADYVFGCMASNAQTQEMLQKCSCSIDVISSLIPYDEYVQAETVLRMVQRPGDSTSVFRDAAWTKSVVEDLRRAQAEAEIRCF
jgi:hypothetical protein